MSTKIDLDALPLGEGDGVLHGDAASDFFFVVGGGGGAVFNTALGGSHFGGMQQSGNEGGFAAVSMPHYSDIADLTSLVRFHGLLLRKARWRRDLEQKKHGPASASFSKDGCYHSESVNVL